MHSFDLGAGRALVLHDHVGSIELDELQEVARIVRRCNAHVEQMTGLRIRGDIMYFLLPLEPSLNSYTFMYEPIPSEANRWAWVGAVAFLPGEGIWRTEDYSLDLYEALLLTAPHELTEQVLTELPNLQVDQIGGKSNHTRWFQDGAPEYVASEFVKHELPWLWEADRFDRNQIQTVMDNDAIRVNLLEWSGTVGYFWGQDNSTQAPVDEYKRYAAAQLLLEVWTQKLELREIVAQIQAHASPVDGAALLELVEQATGLGPEEFLEAGRQWGRTQSPSNSGTETDS